MNVSEAPPEGLEALQDLSLGLGDVVGERYRVEGVLDAGGMGVICTARHVQIGLPVAIKFLRRQWCQDPAMVERFVEEARAACALQSEHIVRVTDFGVLPPDKPYLVMDRLEGSHLGALVEERGPLPIDSAIDYALQACSALETAHRAGIVHRDIKPENLFLAASGDRFIVKVVDFGIAKRLDADAKRMTGPQEQVGSPFYMSPEQITSPRDVDARTDIWSMGVVLYRLLTAEVPFDGDSITTVCARVLHAAPRPLRQVRPDISPELEAVVARCLEKDPARRYSSARELANDLVLCREEMHRTFPLELRRPPAVRPAPPELDLGDRPTKSDLPMSRVRGRHFAAAGALVAIGAALYSAHRFEGKPPPQGEFFLGPSVASDVPRLIVPVPSVRREEKETPPDETTAMDRDDAPSVAAEHEEPPLRMSEPDPPQSIPRPRARPSRESGYERYLRENGLRPLREVLSEVERESRAAPTQVERKRERESRTGTLSEDEF